MRDNACMVSKAFRENLRKAYAPPPKRSVMTAVWWWLIVPYLSFMLGGLVAIHLFGLTEKGKKLDECIQERAALRTLQRIGERHGR